jgi:15-cis-phytoene synthase
MDKQVLQSYRWSKQICRSSGSSFCWTFNLLSRSQCMAMQSLYAFARITDDLGDGNAELELRRQLLDVWMRKTQMLELSLDAPFLGSTAIGEFDPLWPALRYTMKKYSIPTQWLVELVSGVVMDLDHKMPADWKALDDYCYRVASTVGLACTRIWQADPSMPEQLPIDCGIAFQLTNILRDVTKDLKMRRTYIPLSEFEKFDVDAVKWSEGQVSGRWKEMLRCVADRALQLYASGWRTIDYLNGRGRRMFSLMWRYYRALLLEVIQNIDYLPSPKQIRIPTTLKARLAAQHFIAPLYWTLPRAV